MIQVNLPENELNDFLRLATELQLKGVEVSEEQHDIERDDKDYRLTEKLSSDW